MKIFAIRPLRYLIVTLFWLLVWYLAARWVNLPLLLPGPERTFAAFFQMACTLDFWKSTGYTMLRVIAGFSSAVALGVVLGILCHFVQLAEIFLSPLRSIIKATPVTSFIMLVLLWVSKGQVPAFISFLMVLPIVWTAVQGALGATDKNLLEMAKAYHYSFRRRLLWIYWPSVLPHFMASSMTGLGFAWKSGIAAEAIALPAFAIGSQLYNTKIYLEREQLFAWTLTVIVLSMALEAALKKAAGKFRGGTAGWN